MRSLYQMGGMGGGNAYAEHAVCAIPRSAAFAQCTNAVPVQQPGGLIGAAGTPPPPSATAPVVCDL